MRNLDTIIGSAVSLDALLPEHVGPHYLGWLVDPEATRFTEVGRAPNDAASVRRYVEDAVASRTAAIWRICVDGRHVGNIRLSLINTHHRRADIAILVGEPAMRGRGVGTEAIRLLTTHALERLGLDRLSAWIYAGNEASRRAFEKAGYRLDAVLHRHAVFDGQRIDVMVLARFADERKAA